MRFSLILLTCMTLAGCSRATDSQLGNTSTAGADTTPSTPTLDITFETAAEPDASEVDDVDDGDVPELDTDAGPAAVPTDVPRGRAGDADVAPEVDLPSPPPDDDDDGAPNDDDNCPTTPNPEQDDTDGDGIGDLCEGDTDADGVVDDDDNCPDLPNPEQGDADADGLGDACEPDIDEDGTPDDKDNCPKAPNSDQADSDGDGIGDACEADSDEDGVVDDDDNCPDLPNPEQGDTDADGLGDACEPDIDEDGAPDDTDNCPVEPNSDQADSDGDGVGDACEADSDEDGVPDDDDNCPDTQNNNQADADGDGVGNACESDADEDGIPDDGDLFPEDGDLPGAADTAMIYPHTSSKLYRLDASNLELIELGPFNWPADGGSHSMTDLALDSYGTIFGVSFTHLYTCHPETVACTSLGALPGSYNGLTMLPPGTLDPNLDVLVAISTAGQWYRLDVVGGQVNATSLGSYGPGYSSSGDAYAIQDVGTYAAVNASGSSVDLLVALDPLTGAVDYEIGPIGTYSNVWGLAGWLGRAYAFDSSGAVLQVDLATGISTPVLLTSHSWWGAGVATQLQ